MTRSSLQRALLGAALAIAFALPGLPPVFGQATPGPFIPSPERHGTLLESSEATRYQGLLQKGSRAPRDTYDVRYYTLDLRFDPAVSQVSGTVVIEVLALDPAGLSTVELDLSDAMAVSALTVEGAPAAWQHASDLLTVTLDPAAPMGETRSIAVTYAGVPAAGVYFDTHGGGAPIVWSLSEPEDARLWWPCKDSPNDKADGVEMRFSVPTGMTVGAPGVFLGTEDLGAFTAWSFRFDFPIATYLVSIAATNYEVVTSTYTSLDGSATIPVEAYCYPEVLSQCEASFAGVPDILHALAGAFGEYPFLPHRYGNAMCPLGGAMEHPTLVSYGSGLVDGTRNNDWVIAHETAHQWWGDLVTCGTWQDIWLNEGFASHGEALWTEGVWGIGTYHQYMKAAFWENFDASRGPIYGNPRLFGRVVYHKGAWVQHMLRHVMGDAEFFQMLADWGVRKAHGSAVTAEYQAHAESWHGEPLGWFFDEWIYGAGMPYYEVWSSAAPVPGGTRIYLRVRQVQSDAPPFAMPVDLRLNGPGGPQTRVLWVDAASEDFVFEVPETVDSVEFDPEEWILRTLTVGSWEDKDGDTIPDEYEDEDGDGVRDGEDCDPADPDIGPRPPEVPLLRLAGVPDTVLTWDRVPFAETYQVTRGLISLLAPGAYGECAVRDLPSPRWTDATMPPAGDGFFYLVSGWDLDCGLSGPLGSDSSGTPQVNLDPNACP